MPSLLAAFVVAGLVGWLSDEFILKPFRASGFITTAIGSIALTIALENVVRFIFANQMRGYNLPLRRDWVFDGLRVGPQQVENLVVAVDRHAAADCVSADDAHRQGDAGRRRQPVAGLDQGHRRRQRGAHRLVRRHGACRASAAC